ncbi:MAG TPA: quinone-dependent dihydroorotate dehydrogenase [Pyrinomonadaceae bacterium]|nr:quinone-dependent dihydroorotate dehydrogenase [Pyrinomonadaceae bacterium]
MSFYQSLIRPMLFKMPTETAHEFGIEALKIGLSSKFSQDLAAKRFASESFGELCRFGLPFKNPLGVAAGFDKNGVVVNQLAALGFGFVEVGTVTFEPQKGNPKPRLFRLQADKALINRLGFNNEGTPKVVERLKKIKPNCILGVNIGKNKDVPNEEAVENYLKSFDLAHKVADYITVNVSSPNTPNLRELQKAENLEELLSALKKRGQELSSVLSPDFSRQNAEGKPPEGGTQNADEIQEKPLLVKIAPDLSESEIEAIADICLRKELSGIIAANTTVSRENLKTNSIKIAKIGQGGLSGKPLQKRSNEVISKIHKFSKGKLPIIGVGGIFTAEDAFEKIAAGACLVQAYTGFVYQGFAFARDVNSGLAKILKEKGFDSLNEAVGSKIV